MAVEVFHDDVRADLLEKRYELFLFAVMRDVRHLELLAVREKEEIVAVEEFRDGGTERLLGIKNHLQIPWSQDILTHALRTKQKITRDAKSFHAIENHTLQLGLRVLVFVSEGRDEVDEKNIVFEWQTLRREVGTRKKILFSNYSRTLII